MIRLCNRVIRPRIHFCRVPRGRAGTLATARLISHMIREGAKDFVVRQKAITRIASRNVNAPAAG